MTKRTINLNSIDEVKTFVHIMNKYDINVDLVCGRYMVDAKSIMGVFSLDLNKKIECSIHESETNCADLLREIAAFCA